MTAVKYVVVSCPQSAGVIEAEAVVKCGTKMALEDSIQRGEVVVGKSNSGITLFFFPSVTIGEEVITKETLRMSKAKSSNDDAYDEIASALRTEITWAGWQHECKDDDDEKPTAIRSCAFCSEISTYTIET